jgi:hypothetical protein
MPEGPPNVQGRNVLFSVGGAEMRRRSVAPKWGSERQPRLCEEIAV